MGDVPGKNFGLIIAYLLPGFVTLWGVSLFSPTVTSWINSSQQNSPTVGGFFYVTLASFTAGLTVSAVRWAIVDTLHHLTGVASPKCDFSNLNEKLEGFHGLVENHYRYYQFYSNMFMAAAFVSVSYAVTSAGWSSKDILLVLAVLILECILFAGSRDTLRKYYRRTESLLGTPISPSLPERTSHDKRLRTQEGKANQGTRKRTKGTRKKGRRKTRPA